MNEIDYFLNKLNKIERKYNAEQKNANTFSIFSAMYKGDEEERLHSRFISYLLSPQSKHGMKSEFLKLFVRDVLKLGKDFAINDNCKVYPNEENKSEEHNIDILILNDEKTKAIIVENKIRANDSNYNDEKTDSDYDGQLERYYHTIIRGKDKDGNDVKVDGHKIACKFVKVFYLTMYKSEPDKKSHKSIPSEDFSIDKSIIKYQNIQTWLKSCIEIANNNILKEIIQQYCNLIIEKTNNDEIALSLIDLINEQLNYWEVAYKEQNHFECLKRNNKKHIAWHITHRFFTELKKGLEDKSYQILDSPDDEKITKATHENKGNIGNSLVIAFEKTDNEKNYYIANDHNGLTYGEIGSYGNYEIFSEEIKFFEFANEETFHLINNKYRADIIGELVGQISIFNK